MENSHKRGWSHFKLKINDWDITFPKISRICQWIGKNIVYSGKWKEPMKLIRECVRMKIAVQVLVAAKRLWGHSKSMLTQSFKFSTCSPLFIHLHFTCRMLMNFFEWKIEEWNKRKELFFCKRNLKRWQCFLHRYIYIR